MNRPENEKLRKKGSSLELKQCCLVGYLTERYFLRYYHIISTFIPSPYLFPILFNFSYFLNKRPENLTFPTVKIVRSRNIQNKKLRKRFKIFKFLSYNEQSLFIFSILQLWLIFDRFLLFTNVQSSKINFVHPSFFLHFKILKL